MLCPKPTLLPFERRQDQQGALLLGQHQPANLSGLRFEFVACLAFANKVIPV